MKLVEFLLMAGMVIIPGTIAWIYLVEMDGAQQRGLNFTDRKKGR